MSARHTHRLLIVQLLDLTNEGHHTSVVEILLRIYVRLRIPERVGAAGIKGPLTMIAVHCNLAIALEVSDLRQRAVDGDLRSATIGALESVSLSSGEETMRSNVLEGNWLLDDVSRRHCS